MGRGQGKKGGLAMARGGLGDFFKWLEDDEGNLKSRTSVFQN